jgi:hypothetical protein
MRDLSLESPSPIDRAPADGAPVRQMPAEAPVDAHTAAAVDNWLTGSNQMDPNIAADAQDVVQARITADDPAAAEDPFVRPAPAPKPVESATIAQARAHPVGQQLAREWQGADFEANIGYAKAAYEHLQQTNPQALRHLLSAADGATELQLTRLAAQFGRNLDLRNAAPRREPAPFAPSTPSSQGAEMRFTGGDRQAVQRQIDKLTQQAHGAYVRGDKLAATELFEQRDAVIARYFPDESDMNRAGDGSAPVSGLRRGV